MKKVFKAIGLAVGAVLIFGLAGCNGNDGNSGNNEVDLKEYPYYVEPEKAAYTFGTEQMITPYFLGNVIYNETVMLVDDGTSISGMLQYTPIKILSVRDYKWEQEYSADEYEVEGKTITMKQGSSMPYLTANNLIGIDIPAPYREVTTITNTETDWVLMGGAVYTEGSLIYGHQIAVSYVYDIKELNRGDFASYAASGLTAAKAKLEAGQNLKIVATGDSVGQGCSSSAHFNRPPYMDNFMKQTTDALNAYYEGEVTLSNLSVGGKTSEWGSANAQVQNIIKASPDLLVIHFGINDAGEGGGASPNAFKDNIETLVLQVKSSLPDCEFLFIKAFTPNPVSYKDETFRNYWRKIDELSQTIDGFYTLDMYTQSKTMLQTKKYMDVTGNGINHLNDYSSRLYTMNLLAALIDYQK